MQKTLCIISLMVLLVGAVGMWFWEHVKVAALQDEVESYKIKITSLEVERDQYAAQYERLNTELAEFINRQEDTFLAYRMLRPELEKLVKGSAPWTFIAMLTNTIQICNDITSESERNFCRAIMEGECREYEGGSK